MLLRLRPGHTLAPGVLTLNGFVQRDLQMPGDALMVSGHDFFHPLPRRSFALLLKNLQQRLPQVMGFFAIETRPHKFLMNPCRPPATERLSFQRLQLAAPLWRRPPSRQLEGL